MRRSYHLGSQNVLPSETPRHKHEPNHHRLHRPLQNFAAEGASTVRHEDRGGSRSTLGVRECMSRL